MYVDISCIRLTGENKDKMIVMRQSFKFRVAAYL